MIGELSNVIHVVIFVFDHQGSAAIPLEFYVEIAVILRHLSLDIFIGMNCECLPHDDQDIRYEMGGRQVALLSNFIIPLFWASLVQGLAAVIGTIQTDSGTVGSDRHLNCATRE
jgi:hypothetical protein